MLDRSVFHAAKLGLAPMIVIALGCSSAPPPSPCTPVASGPVTAPAPASIAASAPATVTAPASESVATPASAPRRRAKIRTEVGEAPFPAPLVDVIVAGHPTTMIVDTGASHHVIAEWLAHEVSVPLTLLGDRATDHAGRPIKISRAENVSFSISGYGSLEVPLLLVTPLPDHLQHLGIGGVLSPQLLAGEGHAVLLDFRGGFMSEEAPEDAARRLDAAGGALAITNVRACGGATEGSVLLVDTTIEGQPATLKIDSGAERSSLLQTSAAGKTLLARALAAKKTTTGLAAAGAFTAHTVEDSKIKIGDLETIVDINLDPGRSSPSCSSDGFLGLDILRTCTLLIQGNKTIGRCSPR